MARSIQITNPQNNYTETLYYANVTFWTFIFGIFYFAYKGVWTHFAISLILAILTAGISWLIYPFFTHSILKSHYLQKGWIVE